MGVSHTLSRRFFWKEDIQCRRVTVVLGGKDLIVNTEAVGIYLTGADNGIWETGSWKHGVWKGDGLDVRWFRELDHGQVFDKERTRGRLVGVVRRYCTQ
jgi:hypothetical protein